MRIDVVVTGVANWYVQSSVAPDTDESVTQAEPFHHCTVPEPSVRGGEEHADVV